MIVGVQESLVATHLIPKRMGSDGAKAVVERFSGLQSAGGIHRYDARIGILLSYALDLRADNYELGFYHIAVMV